jgi:rod shape-determining protein MreD
VNWLPVAIAAWLLVGVQKGAADLFKLQPGPAAFMPDLVLPLAVFVALAAPGPHAAWTCLGLGLVVDLLSEQTTAEGGSFVVVGPYALGYLLAGLLVLQVRSMMIKKNPLTLAALSAVAAIVAGVVVLAALTIRHAYDARLVWSTWPELLGRFGSAAYTGLAGLILAWPLIRLSPVLGLSLGQRSLPRRAYERR